MIRITFIRYAHVSGITFIRYAHVSGITFIRYTHNQKIEKEINLEYVN
jgi:hypothetical protein